MEMDDYTPGDPELTLTPADPKACTEVMLTVDEEQEGREEFSVTINATDPPSRVTVEPNTTVVIIEGTHKFN